MFPIKDDNPTKGRAVVTYSLIIVNIVVFIYEVFLSVQGDIHGFVNTYALFPRDIIRGVHLYTIFTSMFLHGGVMHILGNMLYLYIFGNNIEDIMGRRRFLVFYFISGLAASMLQVYIDPTSAVPNLGASGAIAGVLGAYLVTFPRARVHTIVFLGYFTRWVRLPAVMVLGFWFVVQLFSGIGSLAYVAPDSGDIAFFAHIGGFVAGMVLVFFFKKRNKR